MTSNVQQSPSQGTQVILQVSLPSPDEVYLYMNNVKYICKANNLPIPELVNIKDNILSVSVKTPNPDQNLVNTVYFELLAEASFIRNLMKSEHKNDYS